MCETHKGEIMMRKEFKYLKVVIISIICLGIVLSILKIFPPPISKSSMEKEFLKNKEIIISVADYLKKQE